MLLILIGKTASGKDLIVNKLCESGWHKIITYTSRPIRKGETPETTYHYITEEEFKQKINEGFFLEYKVYSTEFGDWYYGSPLEELVEIKENENKVIILTPNGYRDLKEKTNIKHKAIYVYANNDTIKKRLIMRGDDMLEAERRLNHDNIDFKGIENEVDKIVYNNNGENINDVISRILKEVN